MSVISPARLKPGVTVDQIAAIGADDQAVAGTRPLIRGRALIFWDPKAPPGARKLDAIDTDQITPAADCVSESLETLDERWKVGAFRYLMPDFRQRVHAGRTFVIAGDRFAIGSSREMSPAGLKAVAEEVGLELVIICGHNMGDIFRRNAFNLGLHVVQCPEAVAEAQDDDEFTFDPVSREIRNLTRQTSYTPLPLSPKEEEIRVGGGIFAVGRREFRDSVVTPPSLDWPDEALARTMTTTEQIVWAHRVDRGTSRADFRPGATVRVLADLLPASDGTAPFAIHTFNQITGGNTIYPRQAAIANDHFVFTGRADDERQTSIGRAFAAAQGMKTPLLRHTRGRHLSFLLSGAGTRPARAVHSGRRLAQSGLRRVRRGGHRGRVHDARVRLGDGAVYFTLARARRVDLRRPAESLGRRQGHRARAATPVGGGAVPGHVGGVRGSRTGSCRWWRATPSRT